MAWETYERNFKQVMPSGSSVRKSKSGVTVTVPCAEGHDCEIELKTAMPGHNTRKVLQNKGWRILKKKAFCPDCEAKKKETPMQPSKKPEPANDTATQTAKRAKRNALRWLDECFDTDKGRYDDGWSDQKVASESGLSVKAIVDLREAFGFEFKKPPEIEVWKDKVAEMKAEIEGLQREAQSVCLRMLKEIENLNERIDKWEDNQ